MMRTRIGRYSLVVAVLVATAVSLHAQSGTPAVLTGWVTKDSLLSAEPYWRVLYDTFEPDSLALKVLESWNIDQDVLVFLGTWCSDSRREIPRFLKTVNEIQNRHVHYRLYGLDRTKKDNAGLTEKYDILQVPTFIVLEGGNELGRIVEEPIQSVECDWVGILLDDPDWHDRVERAALAFRSVEATFVLPFYVRP